MKRSGGGRPARRMGLGLAFLAAFATAASAQNAFTLTIKDHKFDPAELRIPARQGATLVVENHDATPEEFESKSLRIEKVIPGKGSATFKLRALDPGRYGFFGEFHEDTAKGEIVAE
jgi:plastocyanin